MGNYPYINHQDKLNQLIIDLSKKVYSDSEIENLFTRFSIIYEEKDGIVPFRHSYGSISGIVNKCSENNFEVFTIWDQNFNSIIDVIRAAAEHEENASTKESYVRLQLRIAKLRDHISLEEMRIKVLHENIGAIRTQYSTLKENANIAQQKAEEAAKIKTEVISILGIFSAVVLAFMGGLSLLGSTFQALETASSYKVFAAAILCAFAMFNTVSVLIYFVAKLSERSIVTSCNKAEYTELKTDGKKAEKNTSRSKNNCIGCSKKCCLLMRFIRRLPLIFWIDIILLTMLLVCVLAWFLDFHGLAQWIGHCLPWISTQ